MAIPVTCPSCMKRFSVSDKFAGKSGPCPSCKKTIRIPEKSDQIVIHAPDEAAPKDAKGRSILKPIRRTEVKLSMPVILVATLSALVVVGLAFGFRLSGGAPVALLAVGAVVLAMPLVFVGYWFLHDDELAAFRGRELLVRCSVCAAVFAGLWGLYAYLPGYVTGDAVISGMEVAMLLPIMIALGTVASVLSFELEVLQGTLHYAFYLIVTLALAWLADAPLLAPRDAASSVPTRPAVTRPADATGTPAPVKPTPVQPTPAAPAELPPAIPKLLQ